MDVAESHIVAGGGIGLAQLQAQGQGTVAGVGGDAVFHMVGAPGGEAAAIEGAVGVLAVAVEAGLILGLVRGGADVEADRIGAAGLQGHAGGGVELGLPDASALLGGLGDLQGGAVAALLQAHLVVAVVALIDRVGAVEGDVRGDGLVAVGDEGGDDLAGGDHLVQGEARRQQALVVVLDLLDVQRAHLHGGLLRGLAQRELQHQLLAAVADDHGLDGLGLSGLQLLLIEGAVALLLLAAVEEELIGEGPVTAQIRRDAIADAGLGHKARMDVEAGLPHAGIPGRRGIVEADLAGLPGEPGVIALVMALIDQRLFLEVHRGLQGVLQLHHVGVLLHLDLAELDGEGGQHAQLQVQIAGAAGGDQDAGDAVLALLDVELLEVAELDLAGHVGGEAIGHPVVPAGDGGIVALQLHMPGLAVGLGGGEAVLPVHHLAGAGDIAALELGPEQVGLDMGGLDRTGSCEDVRLPVASGRQGLGRGRDRAPVPHRRGAPLLPAGSQQQRRQQQHCNDRSLLFHERILLADTCPCAPRVFPGTSAQNVNNRTA